jgi:hypothetical protein
MREIIAAAQDIVFGVPIVLLNRGVKDQSWQAATPTIG